MLVQSIFGQIKSLCAEHKKINLKSKSVSDAISSNIWTSYHKHFKSLKKGGFAIIPQWTFLR